MNGFTPKTRISGRPVHQEDRMTVSPNQPQDGNQTNSYRADAHATGTKPSTDPLPPTLFALPDLHGKRTEPAPLPSTSSQPTPEPATADTVRPEHEYEQHVEHDLATSMPAESNTRDAEPVMKAKSSDGDLPARDFEIADPSEFLTNERNKSLLDRVGSHAIVLVMLLIVFGIALFAGKDPASDSEASVATSEVTPQPNAKRGTPATAPRAKQQLAMTTVAGSSASTTSAVGAVGPALAVGNPNIAPVETTVAQSESTQGQGIAASAVSTRTTQLSNTKTVVSQPVAGQVSDLLQDATITNKASVPATANGRPVQTSSNHATPSTYRQTQTPQKVMDWTRYLPGDASYVTPASATMPQPQ